MMVKCIVLDSEEQNRISRDDAFQKEPSNATCRHLIIPPPHQSLCHYVIIYHDYKNKKRQANFAGRIPPEVVFHR